METWSPTSPSTPASRSRASSRRETDALKERHDSPAGEVVLREVLPEDEQFLLDLYASTRDDLRATGLTDAELGPLIDFQARAQHADYTRNYTADGHLLIELEGMPVGRVWIDRRADAFLVVDMALLPEFRSQGIGALLFREIFAEADAAGLPVRLTSEHSNPRAIALALREGFTVVGEDDLFVSLVRQPGALAGGA